MPAGAKLFNAHGLDRREKDTDQKSFNQRQHRARHFFEPVRYKRFFTEYAERNRRPFDRGQNRRGIRLDRNPGPFVRCSGGGSECIAGRGAWPRAPAGYMVR